MDGFFDLTVLLPAIAVLTAVTNILVEVLKEVTYRHIPTQLLAVAVAEGLTMTAYFGYGAAQIGVVYWYHTAAALVVGMMVAYAAMFGFDTLQAALKGGKENE
ncbi:MAG: hypothetical protein Q4C06_06535 [Bacillota bacterium]|nr:hypothetical protein [Bacillota bacterium]